MPFDLSSAIAVRERPDGLYEKDNFNLATAVPVDSNKDLSLSQKILTNPVVSKAIDIISGGMNVEQADNLKKNILGPILKAPDLFFGATEIPGVQKAIIPISTLPAERTAETAAELGQYTLTTLARPFTSVQAGLGSMVDKKPAGDILQSMVSGFLNPEKVESITSKVPFQEWEQGTWGRLIPRATTEAIETYLLSSLVYGNIAGKLKNAYTKAKVEGAAQEIDRITTIAAKNILKDPKKYSINFPKEFTEADKLGLTKAYLQNRLGSVPKVGDVLMKRQSFMNKLKSSLASERGEIKIPKVGNTVNWKGETGKIKEITGERVIIQLGKSEVVATLSQLSVPEVPKSTEGKVYYHGTYSKFKEFMIPQEMPEEIANEVLGKPSNTFGIYFTPSKELAGEFGDKIIEANLKIDKPLDLREVKTFEELVAKLPIDVKAGYNANTLRNIKSDSRFDDDYFTDDVYRALEMLVNKFDLLPKIKAGKYDSIIFNDRENGVKGETVIVFDKSQVKLSTPTGEGQKPPIEPPKTAVGGGAEEFFKPKPSVLKTKDVKPTIRKITGQTKIGELVNESEVLNRMLGQEEKLATKLTTQAKKEEAKLMAGAMKTFFSYIKDIDKLEEQLKVEKFNTEADKVLAQQKVKVLKLVKALTKDIPENIAVEYREMIEKIRDKFDFARRSEKTMAAREGMREYVERMKTQGKPIDIPESELEMLDKTSLQDMTIDQLEEVKNEIDRLAQLGKTKQSAREAVYTAKKEKIKTELLQTAIPIKSKELTKLPIGEKDNAWVEQAIKIQNAAQKTGVGLTPIEGLADITGMQPMKKILDADFGRYLTYNDKAINEWYELTKDFTEKSFERIGVVAASRQEGGIERLANSGITEEEVKAIQLTPKEEKAYQFVLDTFDKEYPAVKQYSREVYNADVGEQENYVSFMSDYEQMSDLEIYERFGQTPEQIANRKTKTVEQGFTKERAGVSKIKLETNIDKIFRRHMDDVAYMLTTGKDIKMYFEIVNSPEMREKLGDVGTLAWLQYLDLMARKGGSEGAKRIASLDILRRNIGAGVLSFRLSSALVQFSSFADTIATIGAEWATKGATAISSPEWRNFIMDNFPEIKKAVGDDIAFREFGEGAMAKLASVGLKPLQFLDGLMRSTATAGAYQRLALEKGIAIDLKNPDIELIAEATKLMRQSQGSSFFKDQPLAITAGYGLTDNKSVNKLILTFQSFMLNRWDNINRQIWRMGIKEKNYGKAISSVFWLLIFAGAVEEGIRRGTRKITSTQGKEDNFVKGSLLNILQNVPLLGQMVSAITYSSNPVPVIKTFDDLLEGIGSVIKGKAIETKARGGMRTIGAIGSLLGLAGSSQIAQIIRDRISKANKGLSSGSKLKSGNNLKSGSKLKR